MTEKFTKISRQPGGSGEAEKNIILEIVFLAELWVLWMHMSTKCPGIVVTGGNISKMSCFWPRYRLKSTVNSCYYSTDSENYSNKGSGTLEVSFLPRYINICVLVIKQTWCRVLLSTSRNRKNSKKLGTITRNYSCYSVLAAVSQKTSALRDALECSWAYSVPLGGVKCHIISQQNTL